MVRATHFATPQLGTLKAQRGRRVVVPPSAKPGSRGPVVRLLQTQLAKLGYVVGRHGVYDARTARAVIAFRKVTGMPRTTIASADVFRRLAPAAGAFHVRYPGHGRHVEADLSRQVLALIDAAGKVERDLPDELGQAVDADGDRATSASTRKTPGTNAKGMVHSNYFIRGYAIHGYADGAGLRRRATAACACRSRTRPRSINWVRFGDPVDVYNEDGGGSSHARKHAGRG